MTMYQEGQLEYLRKGPDNEGKARQVINSLEKAVRRGEVDPNDLHSAVRQGRMSGDWKFFWSMYSVQ